MNGVVSRRLRCAIYTRKSTEHNLDLAFTSLDAQREACEAYIRSQQHEGWRLLSERYDDGGLSGASLARPALQAPACPLPRQRRDLPHMKVMPRKLKVSGLPNPRCLRLISARRPNSIRRVFSGCSDSENSCSRSRIASQKRRASVSCSKPTTTSSA